MEFTASAAAQGMTAMFRGGELLMFHICLSLTLAGP